ncbi:MAG: hypothetical protein LBR83_06245 [Clostridiales bacterium]|nr:hypothetical protein [Clostridiales bacterium]
MCDCLVESMLRYIGQTVTIFTTSGGLSGNGFTGVLAGISCGVAKLITDIGAPPSCPIGSACDGAACSCGDPCSDQLGLRGGCGKRLGRGGFNWLGSVTEIPIDRIASFTHSAL